MVKHKIKLFTPFDKLTRVQKQKMVKFLFTHLEEYGDKMEDIQTAIDYAMKDIQSAGGYVISYTSEGQIIGAVVVNKTGMAGYIPENILVYIAIHKEFRGQGIGKKIMKVALKIADGGVALHVEPDNPARFLYENLGFENKYLEMRYQK